MGNIKKKGSVEGEVVVVVVKRYIFVVLPTIPTVMRYHHKSAAAKGLLEIEDVSFFTTQIFPYLFNLLVSFSLFNTFYIGRYLLNLAFLLISRDSQHLQNPQQMLVSNDLKLLLEDCPHESIDFVFDHMFGPNSSHLARDLGPFGSYLSD